MAASSKDATWRAFLVLLVLVSSSVSPAGAQTSPSAAKAEAEDSPAEEDDPTSVEEELESGLTGIEVSFPGQYRINAYSVDDEDVDAPTASRLRIRQGLDLDFGSGFRTHLELQLSHTTSNKGVTDESVRVRHAVMEYQIEPIGRFAAGIVPLSDRFGDTLFSGEWDYNLLSIVGEPRVGQKSGFRLFAGNLDEGLEERPEDDIVHYQAEYGLRTGDDLEFVVAATLIQAPDSNDESRNYASLGLSSHYQGGSRAFRGLVVFAESESELFSLDADASGFAGLVSFEGWSRRIRWGALASWAEGRSDGGGFAPPMALIGFNGYWGYTGILTVQGPTDTGFDGDAVNVSNNGYGLSSLQIRVIGQVSDRLDLTAAAGWFGGSQAAERSSRVGVDLLLMGSYRVHRVFAIDFGVAAAELDDSVSGYHLGAAGGFNQAVGLERTKVAFFTRLQASF